MPGDDEHALNQAEQAAREAAIASIRKNAKPPPPLTLTDNRIEQWKTFKARWDNYALLSSFDKVPRDLQVAQLQNCLGDEALKMLSGFKFNTPAEERTVDEILTTFEKFVIGQVNETLERYKFGKRDQMEGEHLSKYLANLRRLIKTCGYCANCEPSILRDRVILGIHNDDVREELLKDSKLTLEKCIDICTAGEAASEHKNSLQSDRVHKMKSVKKKLKSGKCRYCAQEHVFKKEECPAWGKTCTYCKAKNHFEACCKNKDSTSDKKNWSKMKKAKVHRVKESSSSSESEESSDDWVCNVKSSGKEERHTDRELKCKMLVSNEEVIFQIDTGATCNVLPLKYAKDLEEYHGTLKMWNDTAVQPAGKCRRRIVNPKTGKKYNVKFIVCDDECQPLLSMSTSQKMGLIKIQEHEFHRVARVSTEEFSDVFDNKLGTLPGTQELRVSPDAKPVVMASRRVSVNMRPKLKEELKRLENLQVIEKINKPTPWLSQLVMTPKKDGSLRICIDPLELNKVLQREHYTMPVLEEVLHELKDAKFFTKADLSSGYWHVELTEEASELTSFQTPFGRYKWKRLPFGLSVSAEIFQKKVLEALEGLPGIVCIADDVIIQGKNQQEHDKHLKEFLLRCREKGIKLNKKKFEVGLKKICFMGHQITAEGLQPDPAKVEAISKMPRPDSLTDLRRFIGLVNFMAKFLPKLAVVMHPLHNLLKDNVPFQWSSHEEAAFKEVKSLMCEAPVLAFYDPNKKLTLENDACEYGLGSVMLQEGRPIAYASRSLTETERRYAQIEKEMLAAVYGLEKFHHYTYAREVEVITDHKPLEAIAKKALSKAPRRLQNMLLRAKNYNYVIIYKPGTQITTADALSRAPVDKPPKEEVVHSITAYPIKDKLMRSIKAANSQDPTLTALGKMIVQGWPENKRDVPEVLMPYHSCRDELTVSDGVIMRAERVVIPESMRKEMKKKVHAGHMGINSCLRLAKDVMYWPRMTSEIRQYVETCGTCATFCDSQPRETMVVTDIPKKPWEKLAADLFSWGGDDYLVTYDYHSNFIEFDELKNTSSFEVIKRLKGHFARNGSPITLVSDNGPQFHSAEFKQFADEWNFNHNTISPGNSQANGAAEAAVKIVKRILRKSKASGEDPHKGMLNYYNTPTEGMSTCPAQRLFGRRTRSVLPVTESKLQPSGATGEAEQVLKENKRHRSVPESRDLKPLNIGDTVRIEPRRGMKEWKEGKITRPLTSRSYEVEADGRTYVRNRRHLRSKTPSTHSQPPTRRHLNHRTMADSTITATQAPVEVETAAQRSVLEPTEHCEENTENQMPPQPYITRSGRRSNAPSRLIQQI